MARLFVCTVGTSLLTNDDRPWGRWRREQPLPEAAAVAAWLAAADPVAASAETNTLRALDVAPDDRLVLLGSDTPEGRFCSARLAELYATRCRAVTERHLGALGYHGETFAQRGLRSLVAEVIAAARRADHDGLTPVLCATGGFKAEIAYVNLLGALLEVEVYYIHEQFREIVRLPRLPLSWDAAFVERHRDFFVWIDAEPRPAAEVESRLAGRQELRPLVQDGGDGHVYLNAAGDLLHQAAAARLAAGEPVHWPEAVALPPERKNAVSAVAHHRPDGWERFVDRLCRIDCVCQVRFDPAAGGGPLVRVLDAAAGALAVRYERGGMGLPLRVDTTARGERQSGLVADYVRQQLRVRS